MKRFTRRNMIVGAIAVAAVARVASHAGLAEEHSVRPLRLSEDEWKRRLTPQQYNVLRQAGTEVPFSSSLLNEHRLGEFACAGCSLALFSSGTKFDSGTGWPSFYRALPHAITTHSDSSLPGEARTEIRCARCDGHIGHVFNDGPPPTGLRYCMNGVAMKFIASA